MRRAEPRTRPPGRSEGARTNREEAGAGLIRHRGRTKDGRRSGGRGGGEEVEAAVAVAGAGQVLLRAGRWVGGGVVVCLFLSEQRRLKKGTRCGAREVRRGVRVRGGGREEGARKRMGGCGVRRCVRTRF